MKDKKFLRDLVITKNIRLNKRHFILELKAAELLPQLLPGQFVQVLVKDSPATFLRRPFSIHAFDPNQNTFRLLIQIKGEGTKHLSLLQEGDKVNVMFPLRKFIYEAFGEESFACRRRLRGCPSPFPCLLVKRTGIEGNDLNGVEEEGRYI